MSELLERRYRMLLRVYPRAYRARRAEEILGTLMEAARPGQRRPGIREALALSLGGLRARVGADGQRCRREVWLGALLLAALLLIATTLPMVAQQAYLSLRPVQIDGWVNIGNYYQPSNAFFGFAPLVLVVGGFAALLLGRYAAGFGLAAAGAAVALACVAFPAGTASPADHAFADVLTDYWGVLGAVVLLVPLLRWPVRRVPPGWALAVSVLLGVVPVVAPLVLMQLTDYPSSGHYIIYAVTAAVLLGCLFALVVDARVPIAVGLTFFASGLSVLTYPLSDTPISVPGTVIGMAVTAVVAGVFLGLGALRVRRQAAL